MTAGCAQISRTPQTGTMDRRVLPIQEPEPPTIHETDARKAKAPARVEVKAPAGAPNVVVVLIDDIGFGQASAFGGPVHMPTLERIASTGLRYNRFHTTSLCSPTRTALLTGRNHHVNNAGAIMELATGFPGNTGVRPASVTPLAEILRLNGYSTAAFGKYHETPPWEVSVSGPYDRWPTHSGFDKFYGFIGGETNQWAPAIYDGQTRVEPPNDPNYHFTVDMTNKAIAWAQFQHALTPDKPFFMYFATGATHAPHHVPKEWIAKYKGQFDQGWDKLREETFKRQLDMGVIPPGTKLTPRPAEIPAWDSLSVDEKKLCARQMETFAGFAEQTDHEIGRLVDALEETGELDNPLFFYIVGDNGASAEGGPVGSYNEMLALNGIVSDASSQLKHLDEWGGPMTFPHYAVGWAHAGDTPFQWTKQVASHFGGTRNPLVIRWPARIKNAHGEILSQFSHVVDIAPTVLEAAGLPEPIMVNGAKQRPMDGVSLVYTFDDHKAKERHTTQYFEMFGNRAIYHDGWVAATRHSIPWIVAKLPPFDQDKWELYNVEQDFSEANDLAAQNPQKLKELRAVFDQEAVKNHVYPLDDRRVERFNPEMAGRPDLIGNRTSLTLHEGMTGIAENAFINVKGQSHSITADLDIPAGGANGVIIAQAGRFGGWSLYMKGGRVYEVYNYGGIDRYTVSSSAPLTPGRHTVRYDFIYDDGQPGSGGLSRLSVDGAKVGETRVEHTMPFAYSGDEGVDVGRDDETPVTEDYKQGNNRFTGKIVKIVVEKGAPAS
ncbi:MAG TPA: arylsulfatase [Candidatus Eisenbacteria bacterium]|nr:arylsulfatase [Candidatus Eisenbacteria bacterium]